MDVAVAQLVHDPNPELYDFDISPNLVSAVIDAVLDEATLTWVNWFNNRRLLKPIGTIPPTEAEDRYYAILDEQKLAA